MKVFVTARTKEVSYSDDCSCDDGGSEDGFGTGAEKLGSCPELLGSCPELDALKLSTAPAENKWVEVEDGVSLKRYARSLTPPLATRSPDTGFSLLAVCAPFPGICASGRIHYTHAVCVVHVCTLALVLYRTVEPGRPLEMDGKILKLKLRWSSAHRSEVVEARGQEGSVRDRTVHFTITSNHPDGHERIQGFVDKCFAYYKDVKTGKKDTSRYLFMPFSHAKEHDEDSESTPKNTMVYKRYKLSDEKTFDCYFHQDKAALLYLVDRFISKTGKFAIQGYPHKLGLLLHGPPGTGKTALIKALAQYTNRSVVAVPLIKIKTNQELMDVMFDQSFLVQGEKLPVKLPHSKVCA